jgi:outer membrane immunogenic protein
MTAPRFLLPAALLSLMATTAFAADLPQRTVAPVFVPPPVYDWSGFYIGVNAGVAWNNSGNVTVSDPRLGAYVIGVGTHTGFAGGGQLGYNFQSGAFVYGVETDLQYANVGGHVAWGRYGFLGIRSGNSGQYFGTVRARVGYAIDRTLLYLTGGFAYGGLNSSPFSGNSSTNTGYALGGGVEYAFTRNWTAKVEALYINLSNGGRKSIAVTNRGLVYPIGASTGNGGGLVRVGINYKF